MRCSPIAGSGVANAMAVGASNSSRIAYFGLIRAAMLFPYLDLMVSVLQGNAQLTQFVADGSIELLTA